MKRGSFVFSLGLCFWSLVVHADNFSLTSATLQSGQRLIHAHVLNGFGCDGENLSPALSWKNPPVGTQSFAVTMYDPDAPTGSGWWHWVVYNIPVSVQELPENTGSVDGQHLFQGMVQGRTDFGVAGYGGACPPQGSQSHRYQITVHALKVDHLNLPVDASAAMVGYMINANRLGHASLEVNYSR